MRSLSICLVVVVCGLFPAPVVAEEIQWLTGPKLTKALKDAVSFDWSERPLRQGLTQLGRSTSVAMFLDRRVDPNASITLAVENPPLADALRTLAGQIEGSVAMLGPVVYLGPRAAAPRVQAIAALRQAEAAKAGRGWQSSKSTSWPELAEPRELVLEIVKQAGGELANPEAIPHDVWPAWAGPPLSLAQRLTLVLAGFDLTFELEENRVRIVPMPEKLVYDHTYTVSGEAATVASDLRRKLPEVKVALEGANRLRVTGTAEDHDKAASLLAGNRTVTKTVAKPGEKVYTLKVENQPVGAIVRTVAKELGVEVKAQESIIEKLKPRVNLDVKQMSATDLLKKVLDPAGIKFKLTETTLELSD